MSIYNITLTDPLNSGFSIQPGAFDGPGGSHANSTLRLYGRGALEWGEAVDEDLIRLTETFAGSTPPLYPLPGQLWARVRYYWHDTSANATSGWWIYNTSLMSWAKLNGDGTVPGTLPTNPAIGSYYLDIGGPTLYRWDSAYKQAGNAWLRRYHSSSNLGGLAPTRQPEQDLLVWDQYAGSGSGQWTSPLTVSNNELAPAEPQLGALWFETATGKLKVWTGVMWTELLGPTNGSNTTAGGNLNMALFKIINVADTTIASGSKDAVNGGSLYTFVSNSLTGLATEYLALTGGTVTGDLTLSGTTTVTGNVNMGNMLTVDGASVLRNASITNLTVLTTASMSGIPIKNVGAPVDSTDASTKGYVDDAITPINDRLGIMTQNTVSMVYSGTGSYKAGDLCVTGGNAYIALTSGSTPPPSSDWLQL